jgi:signal transduction histidine kinase
LVTDGNTSKAGLERLVRLRLRLTIWYVATFGLIFLLLGGGLFLVIRHQLSQQLADSVDNATRELVQAARLRESEKGGRGRALDAVDELDIPDRILYLLDTKGNPVKPDTASPWIRGAARQAAQTGQVSIQRDMPNDVSLQLHALRFRLPSGRQLVAVAVADQVELEDRYADLIAAFFGAAIAALILVAAGGFLLVRKSTAPIERSILYMRRFMADAAHELRTPITVLRTRAEVALQQTRDPAEYVRALASVEGEARRLGGIVESLLVLARADSGERQIERQRFFLDDIAVDAAGDARIVAQGKGVDVSVDEFEEAPVVGDKTLVRQLMMILLDNAVKFTDCGGKVRVQVALRDQVPTFSVEDTGIGISHDELSRIFQRFFRGETARSRTDGAGLGLSIASWIAQEHGAEISVTSEPARGTRVIVTFPKPPSAVSL